MSKYYSSESEDDVDYIPNKDEALYNTDSEDDDTTESVKHNDVEKTATNKNDEREDDAPNDTEKKRSDDLWSDFLKDTETSDSKCTSPLNTKADESKSTKSINNLTERLNENVEKKCAPQKLIRSNVPPKRTSTGLGSILNHINKKPKISTLDKTRSDWNKFKNSEGIDEEIQTYNKGKAGFLERQDFLQRTDVRQFELEKDIRTKRLGDR